MRIRLKYFSPLVPLAVLWASFYFGHVLDILNDRGDNWYDVPYMITCVIVFVVAIAWAMILCDD